MVPDERPVRLRRIRALARGRGEEVPSPENAAPRVPKAVMEWLEDCYPDLAPEPMTPHLEMVRRAAQVELVRMLRGVYESQLQAGQSVGAAMQGYPVE